MPRVTRCSAVAEKVLCIWVVVSRSETGSESMSGNDLDSHLDADSNLELDMDSDLKSHIPDSEQRSGSDL